MLHRTGTGAAMAVALAVGIVAIVGGGESPPKSTPEVSKADRAGYTKAFVDRAIDRYEAEGRADTVAYYDTAESVDGQWYVFIMDESGVMVAHPTVPGLVGRRFSGASGVDITGYDQGAEFRSATEEGKWVDYVYVNPDSSREEVKHSWAVRHDGLVFISGWYERLIYLPAKDRAAQFTRAFVYQATKRYDTEGRDATVAYYNTPASIDGEWYVFIIDENDRMIAHAARPERLGTGSSVRVDVNGYDYGSVFQETNEDGQWVSYYFQSPGTEAATQKHSWVVRHDGLLFGSGWYER